MQGVAERTSVVPSAKIIVIRTRMGAVAPNPPEEQPTARRGHDPVVHGSKAAIAAAIFAGIAMMAACVTAYVSYSNRSDQKTAQAQRTQDAAIDSRIDAKLGPATTAINAHTDEQFGKLSDKLTLLDERVSRIEGQLGKRISALERQSTQQQSLARLLDPARVLATIRAEIQTAESEQKVLPASDIIDYKNAIQALPASAYQYWTTIAAIVNYQSKLNQMSGQAPDPKTVSHSCLPTMGNGIRSYGNSYRGGVFSDCVIDLDTNLFDGTVFKDSVIRYRGKAVDLRNVTFVNCYFELDIKPTNTTAPDNPELLKTLLDSLGDKKISVSTSS